MEVWRLILIIGGLFLFALYLPTVLGCTLREDLKPMKSGQQFMWALGWAMFFSGVLI